MTNLYEPALAILSDCKDAFPALEPNQLPLFWRAGLAKADIIAGLVGRWEESVLREAISELDRRGFIIEWPDRIWPAWDFRRFEGAAA